MLQRLSWLEWLVINQKKVDMEVCTIEKGEKETNKNFVPFVVCNDWKRMIWKELTNTERSIKRTIEANGSESIICKTCTVVKISWVTGQSSRQPGLLSRDISVPRALLARVPQSILFSQIESSNSCYLLQS